MSKEAMTLALEALNDERYVTKYTHIVEAIAAIKEALAQPAVQEPETFEQWNAKQHGDPEEIGFLQALRIAYIAGQDSMTTPPARRKPLIPTSLAEQQFERYYRRGYDAGCAAQKQALAAAPVVQEPVVLKPCRSPYCECTVGQCTHPGCYDARHEAFTLPAAQLKPLIPASLAKTAIEAAHGIKEKNI